MKFVKLNKFLLIEKLFFNENYPVENTINMKVGSAEISTVNAIQMGVTFASGALSS